MKHIQVVENCELEWDKRRGVLYVHNKETGATVLRISNMSPKQFDINESPMDIRIPDDPRREEEFKRGSPGHPDNEMGM